MRKAVFSLTVTVMMVASAAHGQVRGFKPAGRVVTQEDIRKLSERLAQQSESPNRIFYVCRVLGQTNPHCVEAKACDYNDREEGWTGQSPARILCDRYMQWARTAESREITNRYEQEQERLRQQEAQQQQRQESERKAKFNELHEAAKLTYAKDVIAQVLNYSSTGYEDGDENTFWQKKSSCVYERVS
jgi:predicted ribosome quality control (RQC) complex YloA/Tae2 family protein